MDKKIYNEKFHANRDKITRHTAECVINILLDVLPPPIHSACDVGGAIGTWIDVIKQKSTDEIFKGLVLDGDYINRKDILVDEAEFLQCDLEKEIRLNERFDLVICLEVAEHLKKERAEGFIDDLTRLGDCILFSAAIPGQGGEGHINEQPLSYWLHIFEEKGYEAFDVIRPNIQYEEKIPFWYKNNIIVYCKRNSVVSKKMALIKTPPMYNWITYEIYEQKLNALNVMNHSYEQQLVQLNIINHSIIYKCADKLYQFIACIRNWCFRLKSKILRRNGDSRWKK